MPRLGEFYGCNLHRSLRLCVSGVTWFVRQKLPGWKFGEDARKEGGLPREIDNRKIDAKTAAVRAVFVQWNMAKRFFSTRCMKISQACC